MSKKNLKNLAFVDIDTQRDFMRPDGALYVAGAENIVTNLKRLVDCAREKGIWLLSSVDTHSVDDPEFRQFPPHCVVGTEGQSKIAETTRIPYLVVKNQPDALPEEVGAETQVIFETQTFDVFANPNFLQFVQQKSLTKFVVFGVATDYCVRDAVLGLRKNGFEVTVVEDAVRAIAPETEKKSLEEMKAAGVKFCTTDRLVSELGDSH